MQVAQERFWVDPVAECWFCWHITANVNNRTSMDREVQMLALVSGLTRAVIAKERQLLVGANMIAGFDSGASDIDVAIINRHGLAGQHVLGND